MPWMYHREHGPRAFTNGEPIPEGWFPHFHDAGWERRGNGRGDLEWFRLERAASEPPSVAAEPVEPPVQPDLVEIPEDWQALHWKTQQGLAERLTGIRPEGGAGAASMILAEIARRASA